MLHSGNLFFFSLPSKVALSKFEQDKHLNYQHLEDNLRIVRDR